MNSIHHSQLVKKALAFCMILTAFLSCENKANADPIKLSEDSNTEIITRISCGSCYRATSKYKEVWDIIATQAPELFLFMGDNVYADTRNMEKMKESYAKLLNLPSYKKFSSQIPVIPVWDDHDYGENDAGTEYPKKKESQRIFLDSHHFAKNHPARKREGTYHSYVSGPEGKRLQIINLDTRYHRSPIKRKKVGKIKAYEPNKNPKATILGDDQWAWLEKELKKPADLRLIVSSIQVITVDHRYEKWSNIPAERTRLFKLLKKTDNKNVILLSGDRHLAEFAQVKPEESGLDTILTEMTSSGLTHANAGDGGNSHRVDGSYYNKRNFGTIEIDWQKEGKPKVTLTIMELGHKDAKPFKKKVLQF